jgi:hypothetical protein
MPSPKPTTSGGSNDTEPSGEPAKPTEGSTEPTGADAHRQSDDDDDDPETAAMPDGAGRSGGDGGGGGGGGTPGAGSSGTLAGLGISTKTIIGIAAVGVGAYLAYRYFVAQSTGKTLVEGIDEDTDLENPDVDIDDDGDGGQGGIEEEDTGPNIQKDPQDPLQADHEAGKHVFGWD